MSVVLVSRCKLVPVYKTQIKFIERIERKKCEIYGERKKESKI